MLDKATGRTPLGATVGSGFCCDTLGWFCCYVGAPAFGRGASGCALEPWLKPNDFDLLTFAFHVVELDIAHFGEGNSANWHAEFT